MAEKPKSKKTNSKKTPEPVVEPTTTTTEEPKRWNVGGLFWGLLIILIGALLLLSNLGIYDFNVGRIWQLWPIIIIGIGVSMLSLKGWLAVLISGLLILGTLAAVVFVTTTNSESTSRLEKQNISIESTAEDADEAGEVVIDTGAATLNVSSDSSVSFADASLISDIQSLRHTDKTVNGQRKVVIRTEGNSRSWSFNPNGFQNKLNVDLTENKLIDLTIDAGAAKIDSDLSGVMLRKLLVDMGAASADIKLGDKTERMEVSIDAGASSITLRIPKNSGVRVEVDGGLSSRDFEGLKEVSDDVYESDDFDTAKNQIVIKADTGASSFKIVRY